MILLYNKSEQAFTTFGIGALDDAISCVVTEELNGAFELEMEYPVTGVHYSDLEEQKIIYAKANDILGMQPFRIYKITRPIDGTVTVFAAHISYDMAGVPIRKINAENLNDLAGPNGKLQNGKMIDSPFTLLVGSDKQTGTEISYKTSIPNNMRALLMGSEDSILNIYDGEFIFDKYNATLCDRRGADRGFTIRYSKNMIDLEQETSSELMYNGVCPYYSNTTTETKVGIGKKYKEIYISKENVQPLKDQDGNDIYPSTWLTYKSSGLEAITNILSLTTTNIIATEGDFYNHLVRAKKAIPQGSTEEGSYFYDATYNMAYINPNAEVGEYDWLYKDEDLTEVWQPVNGDLFRIYTTGDKLYKVYIFEGDWSSHTGTYRQITSSDNIPEYPPTIPCVDNTQEEKENVILYEGDIIYVDEVRAIPIPGSQPYSPNWLQEVTEKVQVISSDDRWEVVGPIGQSSGPVTPTTKEVTTVYKIPTIEVNTTAYPIEGVKEYSRGWLTLVEGSDVPIPDDQLIDGHGYEVERPDHTIYKCRWSADDNKYVHMVDTRYTYTNYRYNRYQNRYEIRSTTNDRILTLDLTDKFKDTPKDSAKFQKDIYDETRKYIDDNKLGTLKNSIKVSFVKLSSSPEYESWKELENVELGDTVHVIYEDLGVNEDKKVIKTEYNVLTESYDSIEIGDKGTKFTDSAVTVGDDVSALTNDRNFADLTTVTTLVAERIKADYIQSVTAEITEAQIQTLTATEFNATLITAQKFEIDQLVASLLTADDAVIRNTLAVGEDLIVSGEININGGSISISGQEAIDNATVAYINPSATTTYDIDWLLADPNDTDPLVPDPAIIYKVQDQLLQWTYYKWTLPTSQEDGHYAPISLDSNVYFEVDESGNVTANSLTVTGGSISISGSGGTSFEVTNAGYLTATGAEISGTITATAGEIGGCTIDQYGHLIVPSGYVSGTFSADVLNGGTITGCEIAIGPISGTSPTQYNFEVDDEGNVTAKSLNITGGTISIEGQNTSFSIDENGNLEANSVELSGGTIENLHITGNIYFGNGAQSQIIEAYVRKNSITYKHTNVTMVTIWDSEEVRGEAKLTINTSLEMVGVYYPLEGLSYDDVLDAGIYPYNSYTDPYITLFKVESVEDGTDFTSQFEYYVEDGPDHQRIYYTHAGPTGYEYTYGSIWFEGSPAEDEIIAYDKQSNWLSLTDSIAGEDGPALTPATGVIYAVYEDGIFKDFYEWNGTAYVETAGPYYINSEGLRLNGIQIDDEQTRVGCLLVTETYLTTNPEKTSVYSFEHGLYIGMDGISLYDEEYDIATKLSSRYGLITSSAQLDIFKDTEHSPTDGATPVLYLIPDPQYFSTLGSGTGRITGVAYNNHTYFTSYIERVLINSNTTITINVQPSSTLYSPNLEKLTLIAAYATQTLYNNSTTLITKPLRVASEIGQCNTSTSRNIKIANDNSFAIYVNVCVVFKK